MRDHVPVRAVARAIDILVALTRGPLPLGSIAEATELTKGTCHRLLASLAHKQLVVQDPRTAEYMLGPGCFRFVEAVSQGLGGLGVLARPTLEALRNETGETITLHVRIGDRRVCVEELPSSQAVRYTAGVGATAPVHVGSAGKTLLAFLAEEAREGILRTLPLQPITEHTVTDMEELADELARIAGRGWAESRGERVVGAAAVSVPLFGSDGDVVAALSVLAPEARLPEESTEHLARKLIEAAKQITDQLHALEHLDALEEVDG